MATDLGRVKSAPSSKYDAFVTSQLARAETRIRLLDLTAALLGFAALSLACIVGIVACDSQLELSPHARQLALYAFLAGSAVYLFFTVVRPLRLRVNPYYAARQVEQQLPGAKNSIVNWVDLHEQPLPPAIHGALGQRAAKDLSRVDLDRAISGRRAAWMGGLAGLAALAFIATFFLLGPIPFLSLLQRAFNPFGQVGVSTRTRLALIKPEGGNATVTVGRGVGFVVDVTGKVPDPKAPDAVKLLYRYQEGDPWLERLLQPESGREWSTNLSAIELQNGLWYKITGGDAATEEYHISVRAAPAITDFLATYRFRPYVARADEVHRERELKALRGTEVLLRARTNRTLRDGRLDFEGKDGTKPIRGELAANDTLLFRFVLDESGRYRLHFTSTDSEAYSDPASYLVTAIKDEAPKVELTKPGQDIRLPADGILHLEGKASDDIGVKSLTLAMRVDGGAKLQSQPYRSDDKLRLADGGYPLELEYKDFIELSRVKSEDGRPFPLRAGMELEYWLEAGDACDYPKPNVSESKHYRVQITEPEKNEKKAQQEKKKAEQDKKQHENKQDQKRQEENQARQQERKDQEARNKQEQQKGENADKGASETPQPKKDGENEQKDNPNNGQNAENSEGAPKNGLSKDEQKTEDAVNDALEKQERKQSEAKPDKGDEGEGKGASPNKPEDGNQASEKSEGEGKGAGQQGAKENGEGKDKGHPQSGADPSQGDGKGDKQPNPKKDDRGEAKDGNPMNQPGAGEASEGKGKPDKVPQQGEGKPNGNSQESKNAGQGKPQPMGQEQDAAKGDGKPVDPKGQQAQREGVGQAKDNKGAPTKSEAKGPGDKKDDAKTEAKQGGTAPVDEQSARSEAKPAPKADAEKSARGNGEGKPDAGTQSRKATPKDVADLLKELKSEDARKREDARKKLDQIVKQARDPLAREKAEDALDKVGQPDDTGEAKPPQPGDGQPGDPRSEGKDGKSGSKDAGTSKSSGDDKGSGAGEAKDAGGKDGPGAKGPPNSSPNGTGKGSRNAEAGNTPGGGGNRRTGNNAKGAGDPNPPPNKPSKPRDHRATQMQLEDFFKKVDKNILKDAGVSEEAWQKYIASKRKQVSSPQPVRPDTPAAPQQANSLPSIGGHSIPTAPSGSDNNLGSADRGQPLPGYRDAVREFTRQMSATGGDKKKK
jgi:hypothetical protein